MVWKPRYRQRRSGYDGNEIWWMIDRNIIRMSICWFALASGVICFGKSVAAAPQLTPPKGCGPIPDLANGARAGALVTGDNIDQYRKVVPPEVADLVAQGELQFEAVLRPHDPTLFVPTTPTGQVPSDVTSAGELKPIPDGGLRPRLFATEVLTQGDKRLAAFKVLWNASASAARAAYTSSIVEMAIFQRPDDQPHGIEFLHERIYPLGLGQSPGAHKPLFREKISAVKPAAIRNLSWLTLRFFGTEDDYVWGASPVINKIRQMTGSNRSDLIFSRAFAPDDLLVWSGKVEILDPVSIEELLLLVPLLEVRSEAQSLDGGCQSWRYEGAAGLELNATSRRFKGAATWVPTNMLMALRSVWRIELSSRDPFTNDSRQAIYVDVESGLPVYRIVWDQSGRLHKVVGGVMRVERAISGSTEAVSAGEFVIHSKESSRLVLGARINTLCGLLPAGTTIEDFDPSAFVKFGVKEGSVATPDKKLEQKDSSGDILD